MPVITYRRLKCDVCNAAYPRDIHALKANYYHIFEDARKAEWQIKTIQEHAPGSEPIESQSIRCPDHHI